MDRVEAVALILKHLHLAAASHKHRACRRQSARHGCWPRRSGRSWHNFNLPQLSIAAFSRYCLSPPFLAALTIKRSNGPRQPRSSMSSTRQRYKSAKTRSRPSHLRTSLRPPNARTRQWRSYCQRTAATRLDANVHGPTPSHCTTSPERQDHGG